METRLCKVDGCGAPVAAKDLCSRHYNVARRHDGDPLYRRPQVCTIEGCSSPVEAQGLCGAHYKRLIRYGTATYKPPKINTICLVEGCGRKAKAEGLCALHQHRRKLTGDTSPARPMLTAAQIAEIQQNPNGLSPFDLASLHNTTPRTVIAVQSGRNWGWLNT